MPENIHAMPCPFCGTQATMVLDTAVYTKAEAYCQCMGCKARGPLVSIRPKIEGHPTVEEQKAARKQAEALWNVRE